MSWRGAANLAATPSKGSQPPPARNVGWSVRRFRVWRRWCLYSCTVSAVVLFVISFFMGISMSWAQHTGATKNRAVLLYLGLDNGRLHFYFDPKAKVIAAPPFLPPKEHLKCRTYPLVRGYVLYGSTIIRRSDWWNAPLASHARHVQYSSTAMIWDLPFVYSIPVLLGGSAWVLMRRRHDYPLGCCQSCGYSLEDLTASTCPECGATITHA